MQSLSSFLCRGTIHRALLSLNRLVVGHFKGWRMRLAFLTRSSSIFIFTTAFVALGFSPNCGVPDDVCREARHLSLLRQETQETHHDVAGIAKDFPGRYPMRAWCLPRPLSGRSGSILATPPIRHFERSRPIFSPAFAPANASACVERNLSSLHFSFEARVSPCHNSRIWSVPPMSTSWPASP